MTEEKSMNGIGAPLVTSDSAEIAATADMIQLIIQIE